MITIVREDQEDANTVAAEIDTIMRCLSIQVMTLMEAQAPERNGAARRNLSETIPETIGSVMAVERRATSKGTASPEEQEEEAELENPHSESAPTVISPAIRRLIAGRSIQRRLPIGSNRRTKRWQG